MSGDDQPTKRVTFQGTAQDIFAAKSLQPTVKKFWATLYPLYKMQPNMSFQKRNVMDAMQEILNTQRSKWPSDLNAEHEKQWVELHAQRLRSMCMEFGQRLSKEVKWARDLVDRDDPGAGHGDSHGGDGEDDEHGDADQEQQSDEDDPEGKEGEEEENAEDAPDDSYEEENAAFKKKQDSEDSQLPLGGSPRRNFFYGYCPEVKKAWRADAKKPLKKTFTELFEKGDMDPTESPFAQRGKGAVRIHGITVAELREMKKIDVEKKKGGKLWTGSGDNGRDISVMKTMEAGTVMYLIFRTDANKKDGKEQILQISSKKLVDVLGAEVGIAKTLSVATDLAGSIMKGEIQDTRGARSLARDSALEAEIGKYGDAGPSAGTPAMKRPAAAPSDSSALKLRKTAAEVRQGKGDDDLDKGTAAASGSGGVGGNFNFGGWISDDADGDQCDL
ncbi:unnamed protein product [Prorocentrum cordatum]|uniref:Centrosomal protein of 19 kDa n=1 Tax=Prorocentrum cordatum TaxID=2364126 RepID=A0ABN9VX57_9DINO|nr:unnamed protein product [Polarella glacialis]